MTVISTRAFIELSINDSEGLGFLIWTPDGGEKRGVMERVFRKKELVRRGKEGGKGSDK